jgi:YVTN family beta-propeller protein
MGAFMSQSRSPRLLGLVVAASLGVVGPARAQGHLRSSPIALTHDEQRLLCVNPESRTVSVFDVSGPLPVKLAEIKVGNEPSSVVVSPDDARAFVTNALDGTVVPLDLATLKKKGKIRVGVEPTAAAMSPNGTRLYVANASSNTVSVIDATLLKPLVVATVDLGPFGSSPRALAVTDDGDADDADETVFVSLFFAGLAPGKSSVEEGQDDQREGRVVAFGATSYTPLVAPNPVALAPQAVTGFNSNGRLAPGTGTTPAVASTNPQIFTTSTGCFPNQLASVAIRPGGFAYVVSTGASPNGPLRFNSMAQGLVSVFDTTTRLEVTAGQTDPTVRRTAPLNLNQGINLATTPAPRLFLTNPVAIAWRPDGSDAWIAVQHANVLVRLTVDAGGIPTIGAPLVAGPSTIVRVDLENPGGAEIPGKAPRGVAINESGTRAFVFNFISRSVTAVDITNPTAPAITWTALSSALPLAGSPQEAAHQGAELFYSGRGPNGRMSSEAWGGCVVCHPNGRSDNVTWMFDAGPRQTIPLDGMFNKKPPHDQRILNWSGVRDENQDFELNTRGVFGGRGLIDDDRLFLAIGGASDATPTDSALLEQFQQVTGAVGTTNDLAAGAALPALAAGRRDFAVATLADDRVFIFGGRRGAGDGTLVPVTDAVLEFNPRTNTLTTKGYTGFTPRHSLGAAAVETPLGPRIYAIGGYVSTAPTTSPTTLVEEYDPATDLWRTVAPLPTAVAQFGIAAAGGINAAEPLQLIHVVSGNAGSEGAPSVANANPVQRFQADPAGAGTWTAFPAAGLTLRRNLGAAAALRGVSSRILVIGGEDGTGTVLPTVEEYTAQAVAVVPPPHTSLPSPRARFGIAGSLSTNQIYVVGGVDELGEDQTSVLEYTVGANPQLPDPPGPPGTPSGAWVTRGNLSAARRGLALSNPPGVTNFLPARSGGRDARQDSIATFIAQSVRPSVAPVSKKDLAAKRGRLLFKQLDLVQPQFSCASCHGGKKWTVSTVDYDAPPSTDVGLGFGEERVAGAELRQTATQGANVLNNVGTFTIGGGRVNEIRSNPADIGAAVAPLGANGLNIPSLLSVHETAPYFYSGLAQTLEQVLDGSQDTNGGVRHHFIPDAAMRADIVQFLKTIDGKAKTLK